MGNVGGFIPSKNIKDPFHEFSRIVDGIVYRITSSDDEFIV